MRSPSALTRLAPLALAVTASVGLATAFAPRAVVAEDAPTAPSTSPKTPDYEFYKARVAPIVERLCMRCHANPRRRSEIGRHFLRPMPGKKIKEADHKDNYETILGLLTPGDPSKSAWLLKPLTESQGGRPHKGGVQFRIDGIEYATFVQFIDGARLDKPVATESLEPKAAEVGRDGLVLQAEDMARDGDATTESPEGAQGAVVVPTGEGVVLSSTFRAAADTAYAVRFRVRIAKEGGPFPFAFRLDDGPAVPVVASEPGFAWVGPSVACDAADPLEARRGRITVKDGLLAMEGSAGAPASWLSPARVAYDGVEATFRVPSEDDGGDDVLVLFDMLDDANGRFAGLVDGGRRFVLGFVEGGTLRALATAEAPAAPADGDGARRVRVSHDTGIAVARLDGRALLAVNLPDRPKEGRFGALTHGAASVAGLTAFAQYDVHRVAFADHPYLPLAAGEHRIVVELAPPGAPAAGGETPGARPALDAVHIVPATP